MLDKRFPLNAVADLAGGVGDSPRAVGEEDDLSPYSSTRS